MPQMIWQCGRRELIDLPIRPRIKSSASGLGHSDGANSWLTTFSGMVSKPESVAVMLSIFNYCARWIMKSVVDFMTLDSENRKEVV